MKKQYLSAIDIYLSLLYRQEMINPVIAAIIRDDYPFVKDNIANSSVDWIYLWHATRVGNIDMVKLILSYISIQDKNIAPYKSEYEPYFQYKSGDILELVRQTFFERGIDSRLIFAKSLCYFCLYGDILAFEKYKDEVVDHQYSDYILNTIYLDKIDMCQHLFNIYPFLLNLSFKDLVRECIYKDSPLTLSLFLTKAEKICNTDQRKEVWFKLAIKSDALKCLKAMSSLWQLDFKKEFLDYALKWRNLDTIKLFIDWEKLSTN